MKIYFSIGEFVIFLLHTVMWICMWCLLMTNAFAIIHQMWLLGGPKVSTSDVMQNCLISTDKPMIMMTPNVVAPQKGFLSTENICFFQADLRSDIILRDIIDKSALSVYFGMQICCEWTYRITGWHSPLFKVRRGILPRTPGPIDNP